TLAWDHYGRGVKAFSTNHPAEGVEAFEAALLLDPTHFWSLMMLGRCLGELGNFDGETGVYNGCIMKRPDFARIYQWPAAAYSRPRRYEKAIADCSQAIELDPNYAVAWADRGNIYGRLGENDQAVADCSRALELDPKLADAWNSRGLAYIELG